MRRIAAAAGEPLGMTMIGRGFDVRVAPPFGKSLSEALTIAARRVEEGGQPFVRVSIEDNGPGLPPGMGERVFEKFTRGEKESAKPGIGLGLAICRAIAEAHGGKIGAANRIAGDGRVEGARFWFTLPIETPPPVPNQR